MEMIAQAIGSQRFHNCRTPKPLHSSGIFPKKMPPCTMPERARELWNRSRTASRSPVVAHLNRQLREGYRRHASVCAVPEMPYYHSSSPALAERLELESAAPSILSSSSPATSRSNTRGTHPARSHPASKIPSLRRISAVVSRSIPQSSKSLSFDHSGIFNCSVSARISTSSGSRHSIRLRASAIAPS